MSIRLWSGCSRRAGLAGALVLATLALGAAPAGAALVPIFDFGSSGEEGGQLGSARGIAINEAGNGGVPAGTVYVAEFGNNRISSFDADGNFIRAWGWDVIAEDQPNDTGTEFEICEEAAECKAGSTGSGNGQFASDGLAGGIAVNQTTGDVYAVDRGNSRVQQFTASGAFVRAWGTAGAGAGQFGFGSTLALSGLGVDAAGDVYVADAGNARVQKFDAEGNFLAMGGWDVDSTSATTEYEVCTVPADCQAGTSGTGEFRYGSNTLPSFLAVSPAGDVYAVGKTNGMIYRLGSNLAPIAELASTTGGGTNPNRNPIAVNGAGRILFGQATVAPDTGKSNNEIFEVNPVADEEVARHKVEANMWVGLAVNAGMDPERLYGTRTTSATSVHVFENLEVPISAILPATDVGGTKATLRGTVNPIGIEVDECRFEYATATSFEDAETVACVETPEEIGDGTDPEPVHADIEGLTPNTLYRFRLTASNEKGDGPPSGTETFTTAETVITEPATDVSATEATLNGSVDPDGVGLTECIFEYGTTTAYGQTAPCDPDAAAIGAGPGPVPVEADLSDLNPGTIYHFRLVAAYQNGSVGRGVNRSFQTLGPRIIAAWSEDVLLNEAVLKAEIDPEGSATTYRFEYGSQGPCSNPAIDCTSIPVPDGAVGDDSDLHTVSRFLTGLASGTTYHFRVLATNEHGTSQGPDLALHTYSPFLADTECPNQGLRGGKSAFLPDCRAYEMVSPVDKNGNDIVNGLCFDSDPCPWVQAAPDGKRLAYGVAPPYSFAGQPANVNGAPYLATRHPGQGWSSEGIHQPVSGADAGGNLGLARPVLSYTPDLCSVWLADFQSPPPFAGARDGYTNLLRRENCGPAKGSFEVLTDVAPPPGSSDYVTYHSLGGATPSGSHAVFWARAKLTPEASEAKDANGVNVKQIYTRIDGRLELVSVRPDGAPGDPAPGDGKGFANPGDSEVGSGWQTGNLDGALAADGSWVYWTAGIDAQGNGQVYLRLHPEQGIVPRVVEKVEEEGIVVDEIVLQEECLTPATACTLPVSGTGNAVFWAASEDGSKALYSEGSLFAGTATLHEFEQGAAQPRPIASGVRGVAGASEDLARIYFVSDQKLSEEAVVGQPNLYLEEDGEIDLVATLVEGDLRVEPGVHHLAYSVANRLPYYRATRVTPDGERLVFQSRARPTGYDNTDRETGKAAVEVFTYEAGSGELHCVSCNPSGARPRSGEMSEPFHSPFADDPRHAKVRAAAWIPTWEHPTYASNVVSEDGGRIFFNAYDALLPHDTNGAQDVYQWEAAGTGSCEESDPDYFPQNGGCLHLISSGTDSDQSEFWEASPDGDDVFFATAESLVPQDPGSIDLYDARVGGGFAVAARPAECEGEACQSPPPPPRFDAPSSETYRGAGNVAPQGSCAALGRRAAQLAQRARRARAQARRVRSAAAKRRLRGQARRLAKRAAQVSANAKRCRQNNRRAAR